MSLFVISKVCNANFVILDTVVQFLLKLHTRLHYAYCIKRFYILITYLFEKKKHKEHNNLRYTDMIYQQIVN